LNSPYPRRKGEQWGLACQIWHITALKHDSWKIQRGAIMASLHEQLAFHQQFPDVGLLAPAAVKERPLGEIAIIHPDWLLSHHCEPKHFCQDAILFVIVDNLSETPSTPEVRDGSPIDQFSLSEIY
jgi:hypothetical protein